MSLQIVDGPVITAGESLSDGVDCSAGTILRMTIPQEFTKANLTFQISTDGNFYNDMYDAHGNEITITAKPDSAIILSEYWTRSINFIKFRSGTRGHPVPQLVDCRFSIAIETDAAAAAAARS